MFKLSLIIFITAAILFFGGCFFIFNSGLKTAVNDFVSLVWSNSDSLYAEIPLTGKQKEISTVILPSPKTDLSFNEIAADSVIFEPLSAQPLVSLPSSTVKAKEKINFGRNKNLEIQEEVYSPEAPSGIFEENFSLILPQSGISATSSPDVPINVGGFFEPAEIQRAEQTSLEQISTSTSETTATTTPMYSGSIVINEIAWSGTATSSADEWIELYNKTDQTIDLASSTLISVTDNSPAINLKGLIKPREYFLLERTNDQTISDLAADQIYTGALNNSGEILELKDRFGNIVDQTILDANKWPAGTAGPDYRSMERVNPYLSADIPGNWQLNSTTTRNGLDAGGQPINGTPKAQNSVFNPGFFYLYSATSTTATSTYLIWTASFLPDLKEYRILSSATSSFEIASTTISVSTSSTSFFDETLESEASYFYKILACDSAKHCIESNIASTTTLSFPFFWSEPQVIWQLATSSEATSTEMVFDLTLDPAGQISVAWSNATSTATSSEVIVLNNKNRPYKFWAGPSPSASSTIYFKYAFENGQYQTEKKIIELSYEIKSLKVIIDSSDTAYVAWLAGSDPPAVYYTFSKIE